MKYRVMPDGSLVPHDQLHRVVRKGGAYVISDTMPAMRHPITGKLMDSKSNFRAVTRAHGCVEVGNETMRDTRKVDLPNLKGDIARAITELGG